MRFFKSNDAGRFAYPARWVVICTLGLLLFAGAACQPQLQTPPRIATTEALLAPGSKVTAEPLYMPAPTATATQADDQLINNPSTSSIDVWINETSEEHRQALQIMADDFTDRNGVDVALQFITPALMPELAATAVLSGTLPDVILHPLEYTASWAENGILDAQAANITIDEIGRDTFDEGALELVEVAGQTAAIPSDGYQQLLLYRSDWFEENRLDRPDNYEAMMAGAETLYDPDNLVSGLVIPTESNLVNTQRAFEHLALANGCQLINDSGEILLLEPECRDALDFYYAIINQFSPPGVQTDTSARNAYLDGRTAMIMSSPSILADLVRTNRLDRDTGIVTRLGGDKSSVEAANFGHITYLGITPGAEKAAAAFANYWFNEGYQTWLEVDSERKVPMRLGTIDRPRFYIDAWGTSPILQGESLNDIVGPETVEQLRDGIGSAGRWGFGQGQGELIGDLYNELTFSIVLQEMLSGYFNSAKTIFEAYNRVIGLIPNYEFPVVPTPEAETEVET